MIRFGILGAGRIGKVHARTIADSGKAKVAFVADAIAEAASSLAQSVGAQVSSVDEVIASDVDAILKDCRDTVKKEGGKMNCVAVGQSMQFTL